MVKGALAGAVNATKKGSFANAVNMAQGNDFAKVLEADALSLGSETVLRGSEVNTMMQSGGYTFSCTNPDPKKLTKMDKTGKAESLYDLSSDVSEIDAFVSHSWRDGQFLKFLSLALYFRAWNSIVWALLPTVPAFVLQWYLGTLGYLPAIYIGPGNSHQRAGPHGLVPLVHLLSAPWRAHSVPSDLLLPRSAVHPPD
jgi:hypothetical protein